MATYAPKSLSPRYDDVFFSGMAILILGAVYLGFARSYYLAGVFQAHLPNLLIHIHGAVFSAWFLLLVAQTSLVSARRLDLHRRLGVLGAGLAAAMVILGIFAGTDALARGFVPPGSRLDPKAFYAIPLFEMVTFCVLIAMAMRARSDGAAHKRLILIATIGLLAPAIGRWPFPIVRSTIVLLGIIDLLVLVLAGFDLWSRRRIHRSTVLGGLVLFSSQQLMIPIGRTGLWHQFATQALNLWTSFR